MGVLKPYLVISRAFKVKKWVAQILFVTLDNNAKMSRKEVKIKLAYYIWLKLVKSLFFFSFVFRGCLFYGPPGTGKTLVARALANECSQGERKVSFFMRKGADCLSKWVGESERQLRLLFDQVITLHTVFCQ